MIVDASLKSLQRKMHPLGNGQSRLTNPVKRRIRTRERGLTSRRGHQPQQRKTQQEEETCQKIEKYLVDNAQGVILWVTLVFASLNTLVESGVYSLEDLEEKIYDLPTDLDHLYRQMIKNLTSRLGPKNLKVSKKALMWVSGANSFHPFRISELHEALAIPDDFLDVPNTTADPLERRKVPIDSWVDFRYKLRKLCGPLIEVIQDTIAVARGRQDLAGAADDDRAAFAELQPIRYSSLCGCRHCVPTALARATGRRVEVGSPAGVLVTRARGGWVLTGMWAFLLWCRRR